MLSTTQLDHYHTQGFVIPDFRLDKETLDTIKGHHERLIARLPEFRDYCPSVLAYDLAFLNYARIPEILEMVEQVLGGHFALWNSSFFAKPAVSGRATPWHQDGEYWPIRP
ncbi:MAG TPA: phytanoyl-CoA dioxygenase family protein, partial [Gammaproteobacteria bacterium]|nr:phytanoyl-CoA dioxygenase family protein [Gammaproteobacteria bacterium]